MQTRSKGCIFSVNSQNFLEITKPSIGGKSLGVPVLVLWLGTCSKKFHKTNENSKSLKETFKYMAGNLPGRHLSYEKLARGNHDVKGHIDFRIAESRACNKLPKIWFEPVLTNKRRSIDNRGTEKPYKYTGAEGSKISYVKICPYASRSKVNSFKNGQ